MDWYPLLPKGDHKQVLRMRRFMIAAGTSFLVVILLVACYLLGVLPKTPLIIATSLITGCVILFYIIFRTRLNLKFNEQTLMGVQIFTSCMAMIYVINSIAPGSRSTFFLIFMMSFLFGVFNLTTVLLLRLSGLILFVQGLVIAFNHYTQPELTSLSLDLLQLSVFAAVLIWFSVMGGYISNLRYKVQQTNRQLGQSMAQIKAMATTDELTNIHNRRHTFFLLDQEIKRASRAQQPLSICMIDLDHFKTINDRFGHNAGDIVLKHFAQLMKSKCRSTDIFGRLGGEEFLLILPTTDSKGAQTVANTAREEVAKAAFLPHHPDVQITISLGLATLQLHETANKCLERADKALYRAKDAGRNRVEAA